MDLSDVKHSSMELIEQKSKKRKRKRKLPHDIDKDDTDTNTTDTNTTDSNTTVPSTNSNLSHESYESHESIQSINSFKRRKIDTIDEYNNQWIEYQSKHMNECQPHRPINNEYNQSAKQSKSDLSNSVKARQPKTTRYRNKQLKSKYGTFKLIPISFI